MADVLEPGRQPEHEPWRWLPLLGRLALIAVLVAGVGAARADEAATAEWFAAIRDRPPLLRAFLQAMPKGADLHLHLSGFLYAEDYVTFAAEDGLCVDRAALAITEAPCAGQIADATARTVKVAEFIKDEGNFGRLVDSLSLRHFLPGISSPATSGHDQFFDAFEKFGPLGKTRAADLLARLAETAAAQNLLHVEVMFTARGPRAKQLAEGLDWPRAWDDDKLRDFLNGLRKKGLTDDVREASKLLEDMVARKDEILGCADPARPGCAVSLAFIQQVNRTKQLAAVFVETAYAFELMRRDDRVLALNFVAPEDNRVALHDYTSQMQVLDFLYRHYTAAHRDRSFHVALHAGELTLGLVPPRDLRFHIRQAIELGHAERIGHGVGIGYEDDALGLLADMARRRVAVEINLSSNEQILGIAGADHPFPDYRRAGVPTVISTDDEGISRSDLSNEYQLAATRYGLGYRDLKSLSRASLIHAFLPGESLWSKDRPDLLVADCAGAVPGALERSGRCSDFLERSAKAALQWRLEAAFREFEATAWPDWAIAR